MKKNMKSFTGSHSGKDIDGNGPALELKPKTNLFVPKKTPQRPNHEQGNPLAESLVFASLPVSLIPGSAEILKGLSEKADLGTGSVAVKKTKKGRMVKPHALDPKNEIDPSCFS